MSLFCVVDGMTDEKFVPPQFMEKYKLTEIETTPKGYETESLNCILNLLAVQNIPKNSRAYFEALGTGINVLDDDLVLRVTWVKTDNDGKIIELIDAPKNYKTESYYPLSSYKALLIYPKKANLCEKIVSYPVFKHMGDNIKNCMIKGIEIPQKFASENIYLVPWAESFKQEIGSLNGTVITGIDLVAGIGKALGMNVIREKEFTGDVDTNYKKKIKIASEIAEKGEFVFLHINGADEASHRKNREEKEMFVQNVLKEFEEILKSETKVLITSDHATSPESSLHEKSKQTIWGNFDCKIETAQDLVKTLCER